MIVGVTGGIGSGKSRVAGLLGKMLCGIVINADDVCRKLLEPGNQGYIQFVKSEGRQFLDSGGAIDRAKLREKIFKDSTLKNRLESILHPLVLEKIRSISFHNSESIIVAEVPLLFESGWHHDFDTVISVYAPEEKLIERVVKRDGSTAEEARTILSSQMSIQEKNRKADYVVENSGAWEITIKQITDIAAQLQSAK